jgi:hypothetical protein
MENENLETLMEIINIHLKDMSAVELRYIYKLIRDIKKERK